MELYTVSIAVVLLFVFISWLNKKHKYWEERKVKCEKPLPIVGNFINVLMLKQSIDALMRELYDKFPEEKYVGVYQGYKPGILLRDPELIKQVLIKDFHYFQDRGVKQSEEKTDNSLFASEGENWRILRQKLTPIFTSGKLKSMMPLIDKCVDEYMKYVDTIVDSNSEHEIRDLATKYTLEVIGSCAFGVDMDAFNDNKNNIFRQVAHDLFTPSVFLSTLQLINFLVPGFMKLYLKIFGRPKFSVRIQKFFLSLVSKIVKEREGKPKVRKDFMDLMIELKEQGVIKRRDENDILEIELDEELIAAQARVFYAAGFETSSATMSFMLHALAYHQDIQDKVYNEIIFVTDKYNGQITYEAVKEMNYLSMTFDETLRKYPPGGVLLRKCVANYKCPGSKLIIPKETTVFISVNGLQHDEKYYSNPENFDPERFSPENKSRIPVGAYLPFGEGPRNCIGLRFAKVQSMVGLAAFLRRFKVETSSKTKENLIYDPRSLTLTATSGIWLKISRR